MQSETKVPPGIDPAINDAAEQLQSDIASLRERVATWDPGDPRQGAKIELYGRLADAAQAQCAEIIDLAGSGDISTHLSRVRLEIAREQIRECLPHAGAWLDLHTGVLPVVAS